MAAKITLKLEPRSVVGRKVRALRRQEIIPASLFGKGIKSENIQVGLKLFRSVYDQAGETQIIYATVGDEKTERPLLISNVQTHPVSNQALHIDFRQVDLKEKIEADIPLELIGESPAVKDFQAVVVPAISEIKVEALPTDLPEKIEVDISILKAIGDVIKVADLKLDTAKIEVKEDPETIVVAAAAQQKEEELPAPAPEVAPAEGEAVPVEGEAPAEAPPSGTPAPKVKEEAKP